MSNYDVFAGAGEAAATTGGSAISKIAPLPSAPTPKPDPAVEAEATAAAGKMNELDRRLAEPMTRDEAIVLRNQLKDDDGWMKRYLAGSPERAAQMEKINSIIVGEPNRQTEAERAIENMRTKYDLPPEAVEHMRENRSVSAAEKYAAQQMRRELLSQPDFVKAYMSGQLKEQRQMMILNTIIASPLIDAA